MYTMVHYLLKDLSSLHLGVQLHHYLQGCHEGCGVFMQPALQAWLVLCVCQRENIFHDMGLTRRPILSRLAEW